jgi:hypothetical protein
MIFVICSSGRLTSERRHSMLKPMFQVRTATTWWWRWSPATDAARLLNG